jgi:hypothetical protein
MILEWEALTSKSKFDYTLGEIFYMLWKLHERDQIGWACAAQSSEMMPKHLTAKPTGTKSTYANSLKW